MRKMAPKLYWQSLDSGEKDSLSSATGMTKNHMCKVMTGGQYVSLPSAVEISKACEDMIDPIELLSPANRKALKQLEKK